ncbi:G-D-S-L family lipolytic protein [Hymenobacter sediminis]|uniref:SGNH/GDSL hydrolase family protein n=1 Tax=Hymenobacter sediminis TaxID=2218621 RepID=UPI000DA6C3FC|nr:SGNH/GDSL hydrolase family protein [Hymenobacter sediminis]RPD46258.1 G-D-S-L family lipolytic protein [Hymenobacter sediminis]
MYTFFKRTAPALSLLGLALVSCQPELDDIETSKGSADFTRYIAVGNSLTAGFSDGGLYLEGQQSSYPNLLAQQFKAVGGGDFTQPLFQTGQENGSGYLRLTGFTSTGSPTTANVTTNLAVRDRVVTRTSPASNPQLIYTKYTEPVNNLGVPGIRMSDIETKGFGNVASTGGNLLAPTPIFNSYFERITPAGSDQTYLERVAASNPTFFTSWVGNNDVLGYATAGAAASFLTPLADFTDKNSKLINALTANGAKGLVATIPDVTNVPFFTTVGPAFRATLAAANVPAIVVTTGAFSTTPGTPATRKSIPVTDIRDANGNGKQLFTLTASPYVTLFGRPNNGKAWRDVYNQARTSLPPTITLGVFLAIQGVDTTKAFGASAENPFPSTLVLDDAEQAVVKSATTAFNNALTAKANEKGLAIFDANAFFSRVATTGIVSDAVNNTAAFISGNLFSLDGVHPTPRGYAIIANEMINAINAKYGSSIQTVNPNDYRGVRFP